MHSSIENQLAELYMGHLRTVMDELVLRISDIRSRAAALHRLNTAETIDQLYEAAGTVFERGANLLERDYLRVGVRSKAGAQRPGELSHHYGERVQRMSEEVIDLVGGLSPSTLPPSTGSFNRYLRAISDRHKAGLSAQVHMALGRAYEHSD